ncbi:hypothetical protein C4577_02910 [Candidatus Parcubacteria bacterium]|nr:MAG: hypothetical protein C4577_02910 [Candidatus Parcubacteria bacterium]
MKKKPTIILENGPWATYQVPGIDLTHAPIGSKVLIKCNGGKLDGECMYEKYSDSRWYYNEGDNGMADVEIMLEPRKKRKSPKKP